MRLYVLGRLDDPPPFADVVADRLLDVDVFAGLQSPDGRQGVPVIGRGDADDVDGLVVQDAANVLLILGRLALGLLRRRHRSADHCLIAVADRGDDAIVLAGVTGRVVGALAVDADHSHVQRIVGVSLFDLFRRCLRCREFPAEHAGLSQYGRQCGGVMKKITPSDGTHE